jgi:hypothetical protein
MSNYTFTSGGCMATFVIDDVQPRARAALTASPIYELQALEVQQRDAALWISGTVSTFYHKQLAQEVVRSVCQDIEVINRIRVREDRRR